MNALKKPINIEFTGTPEAGKTTQIHRVYERLFKEGYKVKIIQESAELLPIFFKKGSIEASQWMHLKTNAEIISANESNVDIILIDRGFVDGLIWENIFLSEGKISWQILNSYNYFFEKYIPYPNILFAFNISSEISIKRRGGEGKLTTKTFVNTYNSFVEEFLKKYLGKFKKIDASLSIEEITQILMDNIHSILPK